MIPLHRHIFTLDSDLAESACVASRTCGKAHVLARIICCHVVQDESAGTIRVFDDDVMRIRLHRTAIYVHRVATMQHIKACGSACIRARLGMHR